MLSDKGEYAGCVAAKGKIFSTEALFMILILEQQKMIKDLTARLADKKCG